MKMIRISPAKLDRYANEYFYSADVEKETGRKDDRSESLKLAGLALRMWAVRMREANKRAKTKRAKAK